MVSLEDRLAITELIALHGYLVDDGRIDELNLVFAEDVTHDLTAFGLGIHQGLGSVQEAAEALGDANPVGHHVPQRCGGNHRNYRGCLRKSATALPAKHREPRVDLLVKYERSAHFTVSCPQKPSRCDVRSRSPTVY
jgi:hypothetical protein